MADCQQKCKPHISKSVYRKSSSRNSNHVRSQLVCYYGINWRTNQICKDSDIYPCTREIIEGYWNCDRDHSFFSLWDTTARIAWNQLCQYCQCNLANNAIHFMSLCSFPAEVGGFMGLLLGGSIITVLEFFDLILFQICKWHCKDNDKRESGKKKKKPFSDELITKI